MFDRMSITVQANTEADRYEALDESGVVAGFVQYADSQRARLLFHTEVDDAFEGQGVGSTLAQQALDQALASGLEVRVSCPFIKVWIEKHPEYADKVTLR
jgi:predicted GNAT family acetyltransferase